jgi:hypothetical protein
MSGPAMRPGKTPMEKVRVRQEPGGEAATRRRAPVMAHRFVQTSLKSVKSVNESVFCRGYLTLVIAVA